ncbi:TonB-dependent receptor [Sorangium cellulosum]|uniref:TonB-dependent receptor n=1 Tax=Sorangium cellulosum TaxID=56 RepID=A0A2L0EWL1_SORCE|nr:TonB-dependent receptor [Sorangium cellulosum]AUX43693.1 TonB-dependent receptor [Sorangium cellulosum]
MPRGQRLARRVVLARCLLLAALFSSSSPRPALAQPSPPPQLPPAATPSPPSPPAAPPLEVVVTGTRTPESTQRATVRTRVVTREEAERRGATNVGEALDGELGVQVNPSAYGSLGNPSAIQIQGFDLQRVLVLEDGERVIGDAGGAIDLSSLPLGDVSRIELVTGPTSSLYGTSAIGGVVNVLSAPPAHPGGSAHVRLEGRSRAGILLQGSGAYRGESAWASAHASFQRGDAVALDPDDPTTALPERSQRLIGLRAGASLGRGVELRLRGRWIHDAQDGIETRSFPATATGAPRRFIYDLPEVTDRFTLHLVETIDLGQGSSLRFAAGRQWALRTSDRRPRGSPERDLRDRSGVLQSFETITTLAEGQRTWVAGARFEIETLEQRHKTTSVSQIDTAQGDAAEVPWTKLGTASLYGQLAWKLGDALTFMPGVRGELHLAHGGAVAPRLALAYRPAPTLTLRASGGQGFRAPSAKEIGFSFDHAYLGYVVVGNPSLVPETSWGVNADATLSPDDRITLRAGGFVNWVKDLIDISLDPIRSSDGVDTYEYVNIGRARTAGVEASATFRPAPWLRAEVGYAYLWTRDDTNDQPLSSKPPHTVQASIRADLPWKFELVTRFRGVASTFVGVDEPTAAGGPPRALRARGFSTIDARLARPLWPSSQVYLGVRNVLGVQKELDRSDDAQPDQRPLEGRTLYLGVAAELPWEDS